MTKKLSPKQKDKLREAIALVKQAQVRLDNMNRIVDEIEQESIHK